MKMIGRYFVSSNEAICVEARRIFKALDKPVARGLFSSTPRGFVPARPVDYVSLDVTMPWPGDKGGHVLRLEELVSAIELELAVGERPFGHYDHTANRLAGPSPVRGRGRSSADRPQTASVEGSASGQRICFEVQQDPRTGAVIYRKKVMGENR